MKTWPNKDEMRRGLALMLQGNPHFAWQIGDGTYRPCRDVGQLERCADDIFAGVKTAGFYAIRPDNRTRWGAIDYDAHGSVASRRWRDDARRAFEALAPKCAEAWLVESSPGGFHVVAFLAVLVPARDVRAMLGDCAPEGVEVFPKQDALRDNDGAKGSLLRFPGKHQGKGTWSRLIACHGRVSELDKGITAAKPGRWTEASEAGRLESLYAVATRQITITGPRQRFNAMQLIAARLKGRAKTEADAEWVHDTFYNRHKQHISTPFVESRILFLTWYRKAAPCNLELPDYPPNDNEAAAIAALPKVLNVPAENLAATVRFILRANRYATSKGLDTFFLSLPYIGQRLNVSLASACNYMAACRKLGIMELVERGHTGRANTYRLLPVAGWNLKPFCILQSGFKSHQRKQT